MHFGFSEKQEIRFRGLMQARKQDSSHRSESQESCAQPPHTSEHSLDTARGHLQLHPEGTGQSYTGGSESSVIKTADKDDLPVLSKSLQTTSERGWRKNTQFLTDGEIEMYLHTVIQISDACG